MSPSQYMAVKKSSARKSLPQCLDTLEFKPNTYVHKVCDTKSKCKAIRAGIMLWSSIPNRRGYSKIDQQVKKALYNYIIKHPQVVVSSVSNDCLKLFIGGQVEPQLVTKLLFQLLVKEIHNSMVSPPE